MENNKLLFPTIDDSLLEINETLIKHLLTISKHLLNIKTVRCGGY